MHPNYKTDRLELTYLQRTDATFIRELVNTPGWLRFIGDRQVRSEADATAYINRLLANTAVQYWVVRLQAGNVPVGVVTLIQKTYLSHPDIGFAFLPEQAGHGYAHEAAKPVLNDALVEHERILATTLAENEASIKLLQRLGFEYERTIETGGYVLQVWGRKSLLTPV